ncbi:MAG: trypsin-like peptidase domain-containing protein [Alphaproteobacteria bacterium]|nr:trypsin-like peptidase domain-containing protein [Alphaproteobacteria bacterium]
MQAPDDRAPPQGAEIRDGRGSGYIHLSRSPTAFIGSAFVAFSPQSVLSAAHVFSTGVEWRRQLRTATGEPNFSKMRFQLDTCGRSYDIKEVHLYHQGPYRWGQDIALVILSEPVCIAALGAPIRALAPADIDRLERLDDRSISLQAHQLLKRGTSKFGKLVSYGKVLRRSPEFGGDNLLAVSVSTALGASGGPLISYETGKAAIFGMLVAEPEDATLPFNIAVAIDRSLETWARRIVESATR